MIPDDIQQKLQVFQNPDFRFEEKTHEYFLGPRQLVPFSTWIQDYVEPFDEAKIAPGYASKNSMTVQQVLDLWEHNRWVGTKTHEAIQGYYQDRSLSDVFNDQTHPDVAERYEKFLKIWRLRLMGLEAIGIELQVWCPKLGICGTIDLPAWHVGAQGVYVLDWKTNGTFSTNRGRNYKKMKGPFYDLWDNKENQYSLQISYYRLILEQAGIRTAGGAMVHLPPGAAPAEIYQAIDYRQRIRKLLF